MWWPIIAGMKTLAWDNRDPVTGLAALFLFGEPLLSTIKATDCRTILASSEHRESLYLFEHHLGMLLGKKAIVLLMKEDWKFHRKTLNAAFKTAQLKTMVQDMSAVGRDFVAYLADHAGADDDESTWDGTPSCSCVDGECVSFSSVLLRGCSSLGLALCRRTLDSTPLPKYVSSLFSGMLRVQESAHVMVCIPSAAAHLARNTKCPNTV